jgi:protein-L-isoaspartate(D-aspartate) O-methyltransferase
MDTTDPYPSRRGEMVDLIARMGVRDTRVLEVLRKVPRHEFVPESLRESAYDDGPLPIGEGQTISQPFIVAYMTEAAQLRGGERVLEIGTGSGYGAAVLAEIAGHVVTIERIASLAERARATLERLGYRNVEVVVGDGTLGWPASAPYDAIVVTAGGPHIPPSLRSQLSPGGRLVMPVGPELYGQTLVRLTRGADGEDRQEDLTLVSFVPLIGAEGFGDAAHRRVRPSGGEAG